MSSLFPLLSVVELNDTRFLAACLSGYVLKSDSPKTPFNDIREVDGLNHYIGMICWRCCPVEMSIAFRPLSSKSSVWR